MDIRITKTKIKKGKHSSVVPGQYSIGKLRILDNDNDIDIEDLKVGDIIICVGNKPHQFIRTSPITKITATNENRIIFETKTSEYICAKLLDIVNVSQDQLEELMRENIELYVSEENAQQYALKMRDECNYWKQKYKEININNN